MEIKDLLEMADTISEEELTEILKLLNCSKEDYEACKQYLKDSKGE